MGWHRDIIMANNNLHVSYFAKQISGTSSRILLRGQLHSSKTHAIFHMTEKDERDVGTQQWNSVKITNFISIFLQSTYFKKLLKYEIHNMKWLLMFFWFVDILWYIRCFSIPFAKASLRMKYALMPMNKGGESIDEIPLDWTGKEGSATFWYPDNPRGWNEVSYSKSKNRRKRS